MHVVVESAMGRLFFGVALVLPFVAAAQTNSAGRPTNVAPALRSTYGNAPAPLDTNAAAGATNGAVSSSNSNSLPAIREPEPPSAPTRLDPGVYRVRPGFTAELVAAEPLVFSPSAMAFDEDGRLFVTEMRDWPGRRDASPHLGRVRMLEDTDHDGVFDAGTVLADNLPLPSAIACFNRGVYVGVTPDILYLKAPQGSGTATVHTVVFQGFGGTNAVDPERLLGSFTWGPDFRIHGLASSLGGIVRSPTVPGAPDVDFGVNDFAFDPRTLELIAATGPGQSGLAFDSRGRKLVSERERPLRQVMTSAAFYARNPNYAPAPGLVDVLNPATPVFAADPDPRAKLATSSWLRSARALVVYRGGLFPPTYHENAFIADDEARVIHRAVLRESGLRLVASRVASDGNSEFFSSTDPDFRPRHLTVGPDGALYVADLRNGGGQGRIYRIAPTGLKPPGKLALSKATTHELAMLLGHTNAWHRETAARLIWERQDPAAPGLLTNVVQNGRVAQARVEAVGLLGGLGHTNTGWILRALRDTDDRVRQRAVEVAGRMANGSVPDELWAQLDALAADPSIHVRHELAWAVGEIMRPARVQTLAGIVRRDPADPWIRDAALSSLGRGSGVMSAGLGQNTAFRRSPEGQEFLRQVAECIGVASDVESLPAVLDWFVNSNVPVPEKFGLLAAFGEGLRNANVPMSRVDPARRLQPLYAAAFAAVGDSNLSMGTRLDAARVIGLGTLTYEEAATLLLLLPGGSELLPVQTAVVSALGHYRSPAFVNNLMVRWNALPGGLRLPAVSSMLLSAERVPAVLSLLEGGRLADLPLLPEQVNTLRYYPNQDISSRALALFGARSTYRDDVIERYRPSLTLRGAPDRGRQIFLNRCAVCHQIGGEGESVGPDLTGVKIHGKAAIASAIIEPNSQIRSSYETWFVQTRGLENYVGIAERPHPSTLVLRRPGGARLTFPVSGLEYFEPQAWSLMPEGLEQGLSEQAFADLLDFLMSYPQSHAGSVSQPRPVGVPLKATP